MQRRRTVMPSGEKSKIKSIMRNCLHSLISCGTQSACVFSIINEHLADLGLFFWLHGVGALFFTFSSIKKWLDEVRCGSLTFFHKCSINWSNGKSARIRWDDLRRHSPWQACAGRVLWSFQGRWSAGWPSLAFVFSARWRRSPSDVSERTWWLWAGSPRLWIAFLWCQPGNKHTNTHTKKAQSAASLSRNDEVMSHSCIRDRILPLGCCWMESLLIISMDERAGVRTAPPLPAPAAKRRRYSSTFLVK